MLLISRSAGVLANQTWRLSRYLKELTVVAVWSQMVSPLVPHGRNSRTVGGKHACWEGGLDLKLEELLQATVPGDTSL
jgi:hypothetical protein